VSPGWNLGAINLVAFYLRDSGTHCEIAEIMKTGLGERHR